MFTFTTKHARLIDTCYGIDYSVNLSVLIHHICLKPERIQKVTYYLITKMTDEISSTACCTITCNIILAIMRKFTCKATLYEVNVLKAVGKAISKITNKFMKEDSSVIETKPGSLKKIVSYEPFEGLLEIIRDFESGMKTYEGEKQASKLIMLVSQCVYDVFFVDLLCDLIKIKDLFHSGYEKKISCCVEALMSELWVDRLVCLSKVINIVNVRVFCYEIIKKGSQKNINIEFIIKSLKDEMGVFAIVEINHYLLENIEKLRGMINEEEFEEGGGSSSIEFENSDASTCIAEPENNARKNFKEESETFENFDATIKIVDNNSVLSPGTKNRIFKNEKNASNVLINNIGEKNINIIENSDTQNDCLGIDNNLQEDVKSKVEVNINITNNDNLSGSIINEDKRILNDTVENSVLMCGNNLKTMKDLIDSSSENKLDFEDLKQKELSGNIEKLNILGVDQEMQKTKDLVFIYNLANKDTDSSSLDIKIPPENNEIKIDHIFDPFLSNTKHREIVLVVTWSNNLLSRYISHSVIELGQSFFTLLRSIYSKGNNIPHKKSFIFKYVNNFLNNCSVTSDIFYIYIKKPFQYNFTPNSIKVSSYSFEFQAAILRLARKYSQQYILILDSKFISLLIKISEHVFSHAEQCYHILLNALHGAMPSGENGHALHGKIRSMYYFSGDNTLYKILKIFIRFQDDDMQTKETLKVMKYISNKQNQKNSESFKKMCIKTGNEEILDMDDVVYSIYDEDVKLYDDIYGVLYRLYCHSLKSSYNLESLAQKRKTKIKGIQFFRK